MYHNSKNNPGVTYPANLKHDESFVVPDKFQGMFNSSLLHNNRERFKNVQKIHPRNSEILFYFTVVLDMDEGILGYVVDGQYLGPAFRGLRGKKLYLMISAVWGHCEITSKYLGGMDRKLKYMLRYTKTIYLRFYKSLVFLLILIILYFTM